MHSAFHKIFQRPWRTALACCLSVPMGPASPVLADAVQADAPIGPVQSDRFQTRLVNLGHSRFTGLLYEPAQAERKTRIALIYASRRSLFDFTPARAMAERGYRVMLVKHYLGSRTDEHEAITDGVAETSAAIAYMRALPGVERVVVIGYDAGARLTVFYANVALNGPQACQKATILYPCKGDGLAELAQPDGMVLLEPDIGPLGVAAGIDPAFVGDTRRLRDVDMFASANGFDPKAGRAHYAPAFVQRFSAAQSVLSNQLIDKALSRLALIGQGKGDFTDDEPMTVPGALNSGVPAQLYAADPALLAHTKRPHTLIRVDGSRVTAVVNSVRPAIMREPRQPYAPCCDKIDYSVKRFLGNDAIRTSQAFLVTEDDIPGVDWTSSSSSTPGNAEGVIIPSLIMTMTCSDRVVPGEIIYDHLAARDKSYVAVEGPSQNVPACGLRYGDTARLAFEALDGWLSSPGRF